MDRTYRTSDLALAAFLKTSNLKLTAIEMADRKRAAFAFIDSDKRQELVLAFFNHDGRVDPLRYMETVKSLRSLALQVRDKNVEFNNNGRTDGSIRPNR